MLEDIQEGIQADDEDNDQIETERAGGASTHPINYKDVNAYDNQSK